MHHDHSVLDVTKPLPPQQQAPQPGSRRSPREDRIVTAVTPETTSLAAAAAVGSGKRKSPDDRYDLPSNCLMKCAGNNTYIVM